MKLSDIIEIMRKEPLANGQYYHIYNRSIAKYKIFNEIGDYSRIIEIINFYRFLNLPCRYSKYAILSPVYKQQIFESIAKENKLVEIIAYCIMPTHFHLLLRQSVDNGISEYISKISDSYTKYFNIKRGRKGPLWEGHFENVLVSTDEQMYHLTRYIHLNPVSAGIVDNPKEWQYSSYLEYIDKTKNKICNYEGILNIEPKKYEKFTCDQISYQRELSLIKNIVIDNYSG